MPDNKIHDAIKKRPLSRTFFCVTGLTDVTPHVLRHTFAKLLLDSGVTMEKVAAWLGHESLDTTRLYVTPGERDLEQAVGLLAE